jgi:DNA polymerase
VRTFGSRAVRLYPIFHPAAALYTPANVDVLRTDFARLPELLAMAPPPQPGDEERRPDEEQRPEAPARPEPEPSALPPLEPVAVAVDDRQMGLF